MSRNGVALPGKSHHHRHNNAYANGDDVDDNLTLDAYTWRIAQHVGPIRLCAFPILLFFAGCAVGFAWMVTREDAEQTAAFGNANAYVHDVGRVLDVKISAVVALCSLFAGEISAVGLASLGVSGGLSGATFDAMSQGLIVRSGGKVEAVVVLDPTTKTIQQEYNTWPAGSSVNVAAFVPSAVLANPATAFVGPDVRAVMNSSASNGGAGAGTGSSAFEDNYIFLTLNLYSPAGSSTGFFASTTTLVSSSTVVGTVTFAVSVSALQVESAMQLDSALLGTSVDGILTSLAQINYQAFLAIHSDEEVVTVDIPVVLPAAEGSTGVASTIPSHHVLQLRIAPGISKRFAGWRVVVTLLGSLALFVIAAAFGLVIGGRARFVRPLAPGQLAARTEFLEYMYCQLQDPAQALGVSVETAPPHVRNNWEQYADVVHATRHVNGLLRDATDLLWLEEGKMKFESREVFIRQLADFTVGFNRSQHGEKIRFSLLIDDNVPEVVGGDPVRVQQVLYHLLAMAAHSSTEEVALKVSFVYKEASMRKKDKQQKKKEKILNPLASGNGVVEQQPAAQEKEHSEKNDDVVMMDSDDHHEENDGVTGSKNNENGDLSAEEAGAQNKNELFAVEEQKQSVGEKSEGKDSVNDSHAVVPVADLQQSNKNNKDDNDDAMIGDSSGTLHLSFVDDGATPDPDLLQNTFLDKRQAVCKRFGPVGVGLCTAYGLVTAMGGLVVWKRLASRATAVQVTIPVPWAQMRIVSEDVFSGVGSSTSHSSMGASSPPPGPLSGQLVEGSQGSSSAAATGGGGSAAPMKPPVAGGSKPSGRNVFSQLRVLFVDDNTTNRMIGSKMLSTLGIDDNSLDTAVDGSDAVTKFKTAHDSGRPYHVVFMDLSMPVMDGWAAARAIRDFEREESIPEGKGSRIVAVSGSCLQEDVDRAFQSGMDNFCAKPTKLNKLRQQLEVVVNEYEEEA